MYNNNLWGYGITNGILEVYKKSTKHNGQQFK